MRRRPWERYAFIGGLVAAFTIAAVIVVLTWL
jgi:hypothetical protein